jgi:hypothetical protein
MKQNEEKLYTNIKSLVEKYGDREYGKNHAKEIQRMLDKMISIHRCLFDDYLQSIQSWSILADVTSINTSIIDSYFIIDGANNTIEVNPDMVISAENEIYQLYDYEKEKIINAKIALFNLLWDTTNKMYIVSYKNTGSDAMIHESYSYSPCTLSNAGERQRHLYIDVGFDQFGYDTGKYNHNFIMILDNENRLLFIRKNVNFDSHTSKMNGEFFTMDIMKIF